MLVELSPWQNSQLDRFWESHGVRNARHREKLLRLATTLLLFRTPAELEERITTLNSSVYRVAGITGLDVGTMVGRFPQVLCGDVSFCVETKLPLLAKILPGLDVKRLIERVPQVLSLDIGVTVLSRCTDLVKLFPNCDILSMARSGWWLIEAQPQLLTVSVQRCVAPNWAALQWRLAREGISLAAAERVVQAMPRLLATTPSTIDARVTLLERSLPGVIKMYEDSPSSLARLLCASETVLHRIAFVRTEHPAALKVFREVEDEAAAASPEGGGEGGAGAGEAEAKQLQTSGTGAEKKRRRRRGGGAGGADAASLGGPREEEAQKGARGRTKVLSPVTVVNRSEAAFRAMFPGYAEWERRRRDEEAAAAQRLLAAQAQGAGDGQVLLLSDLFPASPRAGPEAFVLPPSAENTRTGSEAGASPSTALAQQAEGGESNGRRAPSGGSAAAESQTEGDIAAGVHQQRAAPRSRRVELVAPALLLRPPQQRRRRQ